MRHPKIEHWDDEREIGNSLIVTLCRGWRFGEPGEHVRGFDTIKDAMDEVRGAAACTCDYCRPKVLNNNKDEPTKGSVFIGRPSKWGNPFVIGKDGTRSDVITKYKNWIISQPEKVKEAKTELKGKDLVCFCSPEPCHGDVLLEIANSNS